MDTKAQPGQEFWSVRGTRISTIRELLEYLKVCSQEEFEKHVSSERNDFASWIQDVHQNQDLAKKVESSGNLQDAVGVLQDAIDSQPAQASQPAQSKVNPNMFAEQPESIGEPVVKKLEKKRKRRRKKFFYKEPEKPISTVGSKPGNFIAKEFIYGAIFGVILGMLLAGILNALG